MPISAWDGANNSYLATAGLDNTAVTANTDDPPDVLFGVQATVLPLTIWSGNQVLRLKLDLWTRKVTAIRSTTGETLADRLEALPDRLTTSPAAPLRGRSYSPKPPRKQTNFTGQMTSKIGPVYRPFMNTHYLFGNPRKPLRSVLG